MVIFNGTYVNEKSENVDEYMAATGMPWIARKAAGSASINLGLFLISSFLDVVKTGLYSVSTRVEERW